MIIWRIWPLANDYLEDLATCKWSFVWEATCKWSSEGSGLLQMIIWRDWPLTNDHPSTPSPQLPLPGSKFNLADLSRTICSFLSLCSCIILCCRYGNQLRLSVFVGFLASMFPVAAVLFSSYNGLLGLLQCEESWHSLFFSKSWRRSLSSRRSCRRPVSLRFLLSRGPAARRSVNHSN